MAYATNVINRSRNDIKLEVRQAVVIPATKDVDKRVSRKEQERRAKTVKRYLAKRFGGYTAVNGYGGYYSDDRKKMVEEPVLVVESYTDRKTYRKNRGRLLSQIRTWGGKWGQESMSYGYETDLTLLDTKSNR